MTKLTKQEKGELDAMLSEYVLISTKYLNEVDLDIKMCYFFDLNDMKRKIYNYIEKIKG